MAAIVLALALTVSACGGSADGDDDRGFTSVRYVPHSNDRGPVEDKQRLFDLYRRMSIALADGDAKAVCASFGRNIDSLAYYDALGADERLAECERDVSQTIDRVDSGEREWIPREVKWIRVYNDQAGVAGVTTTMRGGTRGPTRLQFVRRDGRWQADFRVPDQLLALDPSGSGRRAPEAPE